MATNQRPVIYIENPCPAAFNKMKSYGNRKHCKACDHMIYDFRKMSNEEILEAISSGSKVCGVFNCDQIDFRTPKKSLSYKIKFRALVILGAIGLSVQPLKAQISNTNSNTNTVSNTSTASCSSYERPKNRIVHKSWVRVKRIWPFRRKRRHVGGVMF